VRQLERLLDQLGRSRVLAACVKPWAAEVLDALLRQLGPPPAELGLADLPELLAPVYAAMARPPSDGDS
jgi:hypothetical protein